MSHPALRQSWYVPVCAGGAGLPVACPLAYAGMPIARPRCMRAVDRALLGFLTACSVACSGGSDGRDVVFDQDGFDDGRASVTAPSLAPGGVVAAADGSLFIHGHATGDGDDAAPDGRNLVIKLRPDGRPDPTFGDGGVFLLPDVRDGFVDLAVLPDASVAALGSVDRAPVVWKIAADGTLDATFGDAGMVAIELDGSGDATTSPMAFALRDDGSLDIVGTTVITDEPGGQFAARMSATGAVDIANAFPTMPDAWSGVLIDASGSTLVFGARWSGTGAEPLVGRLTDALELDAEFGPDGYARIGAVDSDCREPIALVGGGYAAAGSLGQDAQYQGAVLVMTDGSGLDPTFDGDGQLPIDEDWVFAVAELPSGDLLAQVQATNTSPEQQLEYVIRISRAGIIDSSFGEAGRSAGDGTGVGLATGAAGEIWAAGYRWPDTIYVRRI